MDADVNEKRARDAMLGLLELAAANFPYSTNITIVIDGLTANGHLTIPYYYLEKWVRDNE